MRTEDTTNIQLSLKNLYRLLTVKDYPVYSTGILIGKNKKGLTLGRFWNEYLLYEWRNTEHGRMIWRTSGSKNRYHSEFCNRRENFPLYTIYMQEIMNGMGTESFGNQDFSAYGRQYRSLDVKRMCRQIPFLDGRGRSEQEENIGVVYRGLVFDYAKSPCNVWERNVRKNYGKSAEPQ